MNLFAGSGKIFMKEISNENFLKGEGKEKEGINCKREKIGEVPKQSARWEV